MNRPYILVVDDNAIMTKLVCRYLEIHGFEAHSASDGVACIEQVEIRTPDLILSDVMMPRMDGITLTEQLRARDTTKDIPVIVVTALNDHDTQQRAIKAGAVDIIAKPVDEAVLIAKARLLTSAQRAKQQISALRSVIDAYQRGDVAGAEALLATIETPA